MLLLALQMLIRDKAKHIMLVSGLTFCSLLITQQASVFCGLMIWTAGTVRNIAAPIWVFDEKLEQVNEAIPMRSIELQRVRSVEGVAWAVPLYTGLAQARLPDGSFQGMLLVGLDAASLVGRPAVMTAGRIEDLALPNAVIIDQVGVEKLAAKGVRCEIGTTFEINDRLARVVGLCRTYRNFTGQPYVFTTADRALEYLPPQRKMLSFVLAGAQDGVPAEAVAARIAREPGLEAATRNELFWRTIWWYVRNTGIPISFGTVVLLGAIVGIAIAGQTFYLFIHDNSRNLAALKAMGARTPLLAAMVITQAAWVGGLGYGLGVGLAAQFGRAVYQAGQPPFFMPWQLLVFAAAVILLVCVIAALIGLAKVVRLEAAQVFR